MQLEPYLHFNGACEEALNFYKSVFGGELAFVQRYEGSPMEQHVPPDFKTKIMHATYKAPDFTMMASDSSEPVAPGRSVSMAIGTSDESEAKRVFEGLSDGADIGMPLQKTFWAKAFGMLTDRYGVAWMVNCS